MNKNYLYIQTISSILIVIYFIIRMIKKDPIKIVKSKLDIWISLLVLSTIIPVICNTYVSFYGTCQTVLQYMCIFEIYIFIREIFQRHKNAYKIISNILIGITILIIVVGIDGITANKLSGVLEIIGVGNFENGENRLISIIGYPNALAALIASVLFLNINGYLKSDKEKIKSIYKTISLILMIGIFLTYCKSIIALLPVLLAIYIVCVKNKGARIEIIKNIVASTIMAFLYIVLYEKLESQELYVLNWLWFIIIIVINYLINLAIEQKLINIKLSAKKVAILITILILSGVMYITMGLNIYDEYKVFTEDVESNYEAKVLNNIKGKTEYLLEFDIDSKAIDDMENIYTINLIERDEKNKVVNQTEMKFGTYDGIKQMKIETKESTREIKIEFKSEYQYRNKKLIVKNLKLNQKEVPLQYKYLPTMLVEKIKSININYKTAKERFVMIKDALNLSKESLLTGIGGNGWQYKYETVQSYDYIANKVHSYPAKVILEFGILGIVAYIGIVVVVIGRCIKAMKSQKIELLSIAFAIIILGMHSLIDMTMEYISILIYTFVLLGMLEEEKSNKKYDFIHYILNIAFIVMIGINTYITININSNNQYEEIAELLRSRNGLNASSEEYQTINYKIAKIYEEIAYYERYNELEKYYKIIEYYLDSNCEDKLKKVEIYYEKIKEK